MNTVITVQAQTGVLRQLILAEESQQVQHDFALTLILTKALMAPEH